MRLVFKIEKMSAPLPVLDHLKDLFIMSVVLKVPVLLWCYETYDRMVGPGVEITS